jgi:hypothetical protein
MNVAIVPPAMSEGYADRFAPHCPVEPFGQHVAAQLPGSIS